MKKITNPFYLNLLRLCGEWMSSMNTSKEKNSSCSPITNHWKNGPFPYKNNEQVASCPSGTLFCDTIYKGCIMPADYLSRLPSANADKISEITACFDPFQPDLCDLQKADKNLQNMNNF
jgi:hypothetical protein